VEQPILHRNQPSPCELSRDYWLSKSLLALPLNSFCFGPFMKFLKVRGSRLTGAVTSLVLDAASAGARLIPPDFGHATRSLSVANRSS
jgi:hypothetical protein